LFPGDLSLAAIFFAAHSDEHRQRILLAFEKDDELDLSAVAVSAQSRTV